MPLSSTTLRIPLRHPPPNLINPDHDNPASHRYPLRPQHLLAATVPRGYAGTKPRYVNAIHHIIAQEQSNAVINEVTGQSMDVRQLLQEPNKSIWRTSLDKNLGRLTQGVGTRMSCSSNTIFYMPKSRIPSNRKVTYTRMVTTIRLHKNEVNRVCVTVSGNILNYQYVTTTNCARLATTKCLLNSTVSTPDARFMMLEIKDFYYGTPMA